jgi:serine protease Do
MKKTLLVLGMMLVLIGNSIAQQAEVKVENKTKVPVTVKVDSIKKVIVIKGNDHALDTLTNLTVVVNGDKITINGKEADKNDPRLKIIKKSTKKSSRLAPLDTQKPGEKMEEIEIITGDDMLEEESDDLNDNQGRDRFNLMAPPPPNKAFLGVVSEEVKEGVKINEVSEDSPADKAGLKKEDIITAVNDNSIHDPKELYETIGKYKPTDQIIVHFLREGKNKSVNVTLAKNKNTPNVQYFNFGPGNAPGMPREFRQEGPNQFEFRLPNLPGMEGIMDNMDRKPKLGISIEDLEEGEGVKITNVSENSPADKQGLQKEDIILQINDKKVKDVDGLKPLFQSAKEGSSFKFQIRRNKETKVIEVKLPKKLKTADL